MPTRKAAARAALNGHAAIGPFKTLEKIAEFYEGKARSIRDTIGVLMEHRTLSKRRTAGAMLDGAIAIDKQRRGAADPKRAKQNAADVKARRAASLAMLAEFDTTTPRPARGPKFSSLIQHGYLKSKGNGYIRTAKPFHP